MEQRQRFLIMGFYMIVLVAAGLLWPGDAGFLSRYRQILVAPGVLLSDYLVIGGTGPALVNAGIVGLMGLAAIYLTKTTLSGPTIAAVFTLAGFALFGKTPINIWPVMFGVAISAWIRQERFRNVIVVALFGTALGPVVSQVAFGFGFGYGYGLLAGVGVGMILPGLASHVLHNHQGFNLYNVGFTCGLVGMFFLAYVRAGGYSVDHGPIWSDERQQLLGLMLLFYFGTMVLLGWKHWRESVKLWRLPGTLVTDFVSEQGFFPSMLNMGLVGIIGLGYVQLVNGPFNGPVVGGVFTMVGFAAFGKHVKNVWPIMLGVYLASLLSVWGPGDPGPLLAALFGTTLAPIAGAFGPIVGIAAGAVHLAVVMHVGIFHAGLNLYNNGFAGGLVGTLFIGLSRWFNGDRK